jgi:hypothetical protein
MNEIAAREYLRTRVGADAWALVNLERLSGHEVEALKVLDQCGHRCAGISSKSEWFATKVWACIKRRSLDICKK